MASIRSRILMFVLKIVVRPRIKPDSDVLKERKLTEKFDGLAFPHSKKVIQTEYGCENLPITQLRAETAEDNAPIILYLHGGGFMYRLTRTYISFVAELCEKLSATAYIPWYRLAPEAPYPAAPEDCFAAYQWLLDQGVAANQIVLAGDSAGGNLVLTTLLRIREAKLDMPRGAVMLSPITDLAELGTSWLINGETGKDPIFPFNSFELLHHYCGDANRFDPLISPYYASFENFPPLFFIVGDTESLLDDSIAVAKKARSVGVNVEVKVWRGMPHVFPIIGFLPEARIAKEEMVDFIRALFSPETRLPQEKQTALLSFR